MRRFKTIREIANEYPVSVATLYSHIKTDPSFPVLNVGKRKKFVIDELTFVSWMKAKARTEAKLSGEEILRRFKK